LGGVFGFLAGFGDFAFFGAFFFAILFGALGLGGVPGFCIAVFSVEFPDAVKIPGPELTTISAASTKRNFFMVEGFSL